MKIEYLEFWYNYNYNQVVRDAMRLAIELINLNWMMICFRLKMNNFFGKYQYKQQDLYCK